MDNDPNPFTDSNFSVTFTHESGSPSYLVPGFFAADGNAAESAPDFRAKGRLQYVGNIWPFVDRDDKIHYDCSKLDQWTIVFDHAQKLGLYLHFKTQENENDDSNGPGAAESLDGGDLGPQRKLYYRELIARFGHELALNWNFGEENTQTPAQQRDEIAYVAQIDPYQHLRVIHTFPPQQEKVYEPLLGAKSKLTGASLQNEWNQAHQKTLKWVTESAKAGTP